MARPPCRHMHRAGAWIHPCKPRQGSQCSSCHSTCLIFRAHSLGGCCLQLAVTASGWWMVYYSASITLIHTSGPGQATTTHAAIGLSLKAVSGEGRHTLDHTAFLSARARRLFATGFLRKLLISNFTPASHVIRGSRQRITCVVQRITSLNQSGDVLRHIR